MRLKKLDFPFLGPLNFNIPMDFFFGGVSLKIMQINLLNVIFLPQSQAQINNLRLAMRLKNLDFSFLFLSIPKLQHVCMISRNTVMHFLSSSSLLPHT
jgi:hypothetical protein